MCLFIWSVFVYLFDLYVFIYLICKCLFIWSVCVYLLDRYVFIYLICMRLFSWESFKEIICEGP